MFAGVTYTSYRFEVDGSLARNDFYLSPIGDDYSVNVTLWTEFVKLGQQLQGTEKPYA